MKLVEVEWDDARFRFDWEEGATLECAVMVTVGWVVEDSETLLAIASERDSQIPGTYRGVTSIPRANVRSMKVRR